MSKYFLCKLKNRALIQLWGKDSFKFLQSLTTNDLNKIIPESDFILQKNLPENLLCNNYDSYIYEMDNKTTKYEKNAIGLPSLFLLNNGKILYDCFIYNIKYNYEKNLFFSLFYIDCNVHILNLLLDLLDKRRLSCDVYFKNIKNINIYQLLSYTSLLNLHKKVKCTNTFENDMSNTLNNSLRIYNGNDNTSLFFFSKDQRSELLGYRIYEFNYSKDKIPHDYPNSVSFIKSEKVENKKSCNDNIIISKHFDNPFNNILSIFEKEEKIKLTNSFIYDYLKLNLGIIENLYTKDIYFSDTNADIYDPATYTNDNNNNNNTDITINNDINKNVNNIKNERDIFRFKNLTPFDLNYDNLNYLTKEKGCYVGQEAINRTRNEIFISKYSLTLCMNYDYYDMFYNNFDNDPTKIYNNILYTKYLKDIKDNHMLKSSFFLLKNLLSSKHNESVTYEHQFDVIYNNDIKSDNTLKNFKIGHVFFYNHIIGICFLIKKKLTNMKHNIFSKSSKIHITNNNYDETTHRIVLIPLDKI
ncbi:aminomethyltransferase, putative [Plasmodium gaboni]|uniref:Aminomethyltransferase, putative n=1 Tax=Plasmodium gaboni TaxID=647221 RepID=A0ABY1UUB6_9APIC|nr:aminomethyltransferase, putative [Plasmodium gaboni]